MEEVLEGIVVKASSGFYTIHTPDGRELVSQVRGRLKRRRLNTDLIAVGDRVRLEAQADPPQIIEVLPRQSKLSRRAPDARGRGRSDREQVIVANPDQAAFVFACHDPVPHLRMLDRYLVSAETQELAAIIIANKIDLVGIDAAHKLFGLYEQLAYPVFYTSATSGHGLEDVREIMKQRISVLSGPSGAGKSTLLNALQSGLGLAAKSVNAVTGKGRHTTVTIELLPFEGGYIADTPGVRALALWETDPERIAWGFREFRPFLGQCKFNDCQHDTEPGCAILAAVEQGQITAERYESYVRMLEE